MTADELNAVLTRVLEQTGGPNWAVVVAAVTSVIAVVVWSAALIVAFVQLRKVATQVEQAREALQADHDRTRRERTVEAMKYYQHGTKPQHNKIVELLDLVPDDQLKNLREGKRVTLEGNLKEIACSILSERFPSVYEAAVSDDSAKVKERHEFTHDESMYLRFIMLDILNHYETCIVPWQIGIVDRDTFEQQFFTLVDRRDGHFKLQRARNAFGAEKFPATEAFKRKLFPENPSSELKEPLGLAE